MLTENTFWRLNAKFRRFHLNGTRDTINHENYDNAYWEYFTTLLISVVNENNYLSLRMIYNYQQISEQDLLNGLFFICSIKTDYILFGTNTDKFVQSFPPIHSWTPGTLKDSSKLIPNIFLTKMKKELDLPKMTEEINNCTDEQLSLLFPKGFKRWDTRRTIMNQRREFREKDKAQLGFQVVDYLCTQNVKNADLI